MSPICALHSLVQEDLAADAGVADQPCVGVGAARPLHLRHRRFERGLGRGHDPLVEPVQAGHAGRSPAIFSAVCPRRRWFTHWHASVGKNAAHICGAFVEPKSILVELDNDNFISRWFFEDLYCRSEYLMNGSLAGIRWRHPAAPPCSGRIGGLSPRYQHAGAWSNFVSCLFGEFLGCVLRSRFLFFLRGGRFLSKVPAFLFPVVTN